MDASTSRRNGGEVMQRRLEYQTGYGVLESSLLMLRPSEYVAWKMLLRLARVAGSVVATT